MKIKAKLDGDVLKCKFKATHEMKENFITHIVAKVGDRVVMEVSTSPSVSTNPNLKFQAKANGIKAGDKVEVTWSDKSGKTKTGSGKVK